VEGLICSRIGDAYGEHLVFQTEVTLLNGSHRRFADFGETCPIVVGGASFFPRLAPGNGC
jgi:hypothetical protein